MERFPLLSRVLMYPDPRLRQISKPVDVLDASIVRGIEHMFKVMDDEDGCGLAAPQIGVFLRVVVSDTVAHGGRRIALINPEIISKSEEKMMHLDGCLSVFDIFSETARSKTVRLKYTNQDFEEVEEDWTGFPAFNIQHEIDHLNGVLFIDHLPYVQRERAKEKLRRHAALQPAL